MFNYSKICRGKYGAGVSGDDDGAHLYYCLVVTVLFYIQLLLQLEQLAVCHPRRGPVPAKETRLCTILRPAGNVQDRPEEDRAQAGDMEA